MQSPRFTDAELSLLRKLLPHGYHPAPTWDADAYWFALPSSDYPENEACFTIERDGLYHLSSDCLGRDAAVAATLAELWFKIEAWEEAA